MLQDRFISMKHTIRRCEFLVAVLFALQAGGCKQTVEPAEQEPFVYVPPYDWTVATPASRGIDTLLLQQALTEFSNQSFVYGFLLVQDTFLVAEYYQRFLSRNNDYSIHSAAKTFISALVGIAIDHGFIDSVGEKIYDFFPEYVSQVSDTRKLDITIEHLLTMRGGMDYTEGGDYTSILTPDANWVEVFLGLPLKYTPGEQFYYATPQIHLLSAIITSATGMSTLAFARTYLFNPLSIDVRYWYQDPQGIYFGGTGMNLTLRDLARFGSLYLHEGMLDSVRILPEEWVQRSFVPRNAQGIQWGNFTNVNYGYTWWLEEDPEDTLFVAAGFGGQFIIGSFPKQIVIVVTSYPYVSDATASVQFDEVVRIVDQYVLPAAPVR